MADLTKYPWKWSTMTDHDLRCWLLYVLAGKNPLTEGPMKLAGAEWPKGADGKPDISRLPPIIFAWTRSDGTGGVWWDFDRTIKDIRQHFPYTPKAS